VKASTLLQDHLPGEELVAAAAAWTTVTLPAAPVGTLAGGPDRRRGRRPVGDARLGGRYFRAAAAAAMVVGPGSAPSGPLEVRLADRSPVAFDGFLLVIGKLLHGRIIADVRAVIRRGTATRVPAWFQVAASFPAAPSAQPAWGVSLRPGRYALVCQRTRDGALHALTTMIIR
jgi:hypothetical protein